MKIEVKRYQKASEYYVGNPLGIYYIGSTDDERTRILETDLTAAVQAYAASRSFYGDSTLLTVRFGSADSEPTFYRFTRIEEGEE